MKQKIKYIFKKPKLNKLRRTKPESKLNQAIENLPRITNETVAEHREEMLSSARKYIYPLNHTKRRVVVVSVGILVLSIIVFFAYVVLALYRFQSTSSFLYGVTQVLPFPVAKAGKSYVSYDDYLFELRHYMHYYQTQQQINFSSAAGKEQLAAFKKQALQEVINGAYVKQLATEHHIAVNSQDIDNAVNLVREQNRLGSSDQEFADVLKDFWGWSVDDFRRELSQQLLAQKLVSVLDTNTNQRAQQALEQLQSGKKFADVAQEFSDDVSTKNNGGAYASAIDPNNRDLAPQVIDELFKLKPGQTSGIINTGYTLEILQVTSTANGKVQAAHILFNYQPLSTYLNPQEAKNPSHSFIS